MLALQRRAPGGDRRIREPQRAADHREPTTRRVFEVENRFALAQMRVGEHFGRVENGAAHDAASGKRFHDVALLARSGPAFDLGG